MERPSAEQIAHMTDSEKINHILLGLERLDPLLDAYDSVLLGKKFLLGLGTFISAMVALGALVLWVLRLLNVHT